MYDTVRLGTIPDFLYRISSIKSSRSVSYLKSPDSMVLKATMASSGSYSCEMLMSGSKAETCYVFSVILD